MKAETADASNESDEGPDFWIAIADMQWTYGQLDSEVLKLVSDDLATGRSLMDWDDDKKGLSRRKAVLEKFIAKISVSNPKPKKPPKTVVRPPKCKAGDCLSVRLSNGQYAAALVLAADHTEVEYGKNLICILDYVSPQKPNLDVFRLRNWLSSRHLSWISKIEIAWYIHVGYRTVKDQLELIGQIEILDSDPKEGHTYTGWKGIGEQVLMQRDRDAERAKS